LKKIQQGIKRATSIKLVIAISIFVAAIGVGISKTYLANNWRLIAVVPLYITTIAAVGSLGLSILIGEIWVVEMICGYVFDNYPTPIDGSFWLHW
jgi:hypothetical protein